MKPPRNPQGQLSRNIPKLIQHLRDLYASMVLDPALVDSAEHIQHAVQELEHAQRMAWEVANEESAGTPAPARREQVKIPHELSEDLAEWLRKAQAASQLKQ